jgi:hypothetical protein
MVCAWEESSYMRGPLPPPASPHHDSRAAVWGNASSRDILSFFAKHELKHYVVVDMNIVACSVRLLSVRFLYHCNLFASSYVPIKERLPLYRNTHKSAQPPGSEALRWSRSSPSHLVVCTVIGTVGLWNPVSCDLVRGSGDKVFGERFARLLVSSSSRTLTSSSPTRTSSRTSEASTMT